MYLDGEIQDEGMKAKLQHKLLECNDCVKSFSLEKSIREAIKSKLECKCCPEDVVQSIRIKIKEGV
jgi:hypothetical protein